MSRIILALIAIVVIVSAASADKECKKNEVWKDCGTACPKTCRNPDPQVCTKQCVQGCFCKDDLLRNKWGKCVPKNKC